MIEEMMVQSGICHILFLIFLLAASDSYACIATRLLAETGKFKVIYPVTNRNCAIEGEFPENDILLGSSELRVWYIFIKQEF